MKERTQWWIATTFLVALLTKEISVVNGEDITSADGKPSKIEGNTGKQSDLEGSETSYSFTYENGFGNAFDSFPSTVQPLSSYHSSDGFTYGFAQNVTSNVHQEIMCGDRFPRVCEKSRYRTFDGSCNNLRNPTWGMANTRYGRLLPAKYGDARKRVKDVCIALPSVKYPAKLLQALSDAVHLGHSSFNATLENYVEGSNYICSFQMYEELL